jgi:hypothetical protein
LADTAPNAKSDAFKRRSTRIVQAVPLAVTGVDALGRPFDERTSTSILNCQGCRYQSKHYVLKNMWVTLEVPHPEQGRPPRSVRARVTWIQRPRTVRELFQVGVELEVPGNIWGIAFCPPDWFPFPDSGVDVPAPRVDTLPDEKNEIMPAENTTWTGAPEPDFTADNIRTMRVTVPISSPMEPPPAPHQQTAPLDEETQERLRADLRDYAAEVVAAEARGLLASLQNQLQEASERSAQAAAAAAAESAIQSAMTNAESTAETRLRASLDRRSEELGRNLEQNYQELAAQSSQKEAERREAFEQQLQARVNERIDQLQAAANDSRAEVERSRESLETTRREMEESISAALQEGVLKLKAQAEDARTHLSELESVLRQANERIEPVFVSAESEWKSRLEASATAATSHWDDQLRVSSEHAAQQLSERLAVSSLLTREQFEKELGDRIASVKNTFQEAMADAENRVNAARASFDSQIGQVQSLFTQVQDSAQALAEQARQIETTHKTAQEELERRAAAVVEFHSQELARSGESAIAAWAGQLQPSLEAAGQETVARLGAQVEETLGLQVNRASLALGRLESQSVAAEEMLRKHEEGLAAASARTADAAAAQLQKQISTMESDLQESGRSVVQRGLAEIESKATETAHSTFETLFKTADWYEKKVQNQMQAALDKSLEQGTSELREKAGEISRVFAGELNHYSRSYVEHTQEQMEEAGREAQERATKLTQELTAGTLYSAAQQMKTRADAAVGEFEGNITTALGKLAFQTEEQVARTRAEVDAMTHRLSADFSTATAQQAQQALASAWNELVSHAESARDSLRAESAEREARLREALGAVSDQGVEDYKQRLESAANSWLLTTVSKLNQQSSQQLETLTRTAEARLTETCKQVFANVGQTLQRQMLDLAPTEPPTENSSDPAS